MNYNFKEPISFIAKILISSFMISQGFDPLASQIAGEATSKVAGEAVASLIKGIPSQKRKKLYQKLTLLLTKSVKNVFNNQDYHIDNSCIKEIINVFSVDTACLLLTEENCDEKLFSIICEIFDRHNVPYREQNLDIKKTSNDMISEVYKAIHEDGDFSQFATNINTDQLVKISRKLLTIIDNLDQKTDEQLIQLFSQEEKLNYIIDILENNFKYDSTQNCYEDRRLQRNHNLPFIKNTHFTARAEILESIDNNFIEVKNNQTIQIITGMGGVGKTQIALEYAYENFNKYQIIWWIKSETKQGIIDSYRDLGLSLKLFSKAECATFTENELIGLVITKLSELKNYLLIFDNAYNYHEIGEYLPKSNSGAVLITSRDSNWRMVGDVLPIDVFSPEDAITFLTKRTKIYDFNNAKIMSLKLGFLPLALEQASAYITNNSISFIEYIELFEKYRLELFDLNASKPTNYSLTVTITWQISINKINNKGASQMLKIMAYLNPESININLFRKDHKTLPCPLSDCTKNELLFKEVAWELSRYSLIKINAENISIHRLLQEVIRSMDYGRDFIDHAFEFILSQLLIDNDVYGEYNRYYPHVYSLCKNAKVQYITSKSSWLEILGLWFKLVISSDSITGSWITTYVKSLFEIVVLISNKVQDFDYFIDCFIQLINENDTPTNYLNSCIGNYFLPLLEYLDQCPDEIDTAFYIVLSIVGGRNCCKNRDENRDIRYLERAKQIYKISNRMNAMEYIDYKALTAYHYKWDKSFHAELLR